MKSICSNFLVKNILSYLFYFLFLLVLLLLDLDKNNFFIKNIEIFFNKEIEIDLDEVKLTSKNLNFISNTKYYFHILNFFPALSILIYCFKNICLEGIQYIFIFSLFDFLIIKGIFMLIENSYFFQSSIFIGTLIISKNAKEGKSIFNKFLSFIFIFQTLLIFINYDQMILGLCLLFLFLLHQNFYFYLEKKYENNFKNNSERFKLRFFLFSILFFFDFFLNFNNFKTIKIEYFKYLPLCLFLYNFLFLFFLFGFHYLFNNIFSFSIINFIFVLYSYIYYYIKNYNFKNNNLKNYFLKLLFLNHFDQQSLNDKIFYILEVSLISSFCFIILVLISSKNKIYKYFPPSHQNMYDFTYNSLIYHIEKSPYDNFVIRIPIKSILKENLIGDINEIINIKIIDFKLIGSILILNKIYKEKKNILKLTDFEVFNALNNFSEEFYLSLNLDLKNDFDKMIFKTINEIIDNRNDIISLFLQFVGFSKTGINFLSELNAYSYERNKICALEIQESIIKKELEDIVTFDSSRIFYDGGD